MVCHGALGRCGSHRAGATLGWRLSRAASPISRLVAWLCAPGGDGHTASLNRWCSG
jgi:hypothetical protein